MASSSGDGDIAWFSGSVEVPGCETDCAGVCGVAIEDECGHVILIHQMIVLKICR